jgi:hypothetical protein
MKYENDEILFSRVWVTHPNTAFSFPRFTPQLSAICENVVVTFCTPLLSGGYGFAMIRQRWWLSFFNPSQSGFSVDKTGHCICWHVSRRGFAK